MENYKWDVSDFKLTKSMVRISNVIANIYKKLCDLESSDKKDTEEYVLLINHLKIVREIEDDLYKDLDYYKCVSFEDFFINDQLPYNILSDSDSIIRQNYENNSIRRVLNILSHKILTNYDNIYDIIPRDLCLFLNDIGYTNDMIVDSIDNNVRLKELFNVDVYSGFIAFVQQFIDIDKEDVFKKGLIETKYNTTFINKSIETLMINKSFNISDITITNSNLYNNLKYNYGLNEIFYQMMEITDLTDDEYGDYKNKFTSILRLCFLKSYLVQMSDDTISEINSAFTEYIESDEYLSCHFTDSIGEQLVISSLSEANRLKSHKLK